MMKCPILLVFFSLALVACTAPAPDPLQREFNVQVGPERVFKRPISEVVPELEGARATGNNGRLGKAFVYWGYELANSSPVQLYACGLYEDNYCDEALPQLCPVGETRVITREVQPGRVTQRHCQFVGVAAPGDLSPNCQEAEKPSDILVGLASCPGL